MLVAARHAGSTSPTGGGASRPPAGAPDAVVHAGAWTAVDACEGDPDRAFGSTPSGTRHVAEGARLVGARVCYVSTDYVFDGTGDRPYREWDDPNPLSVYGRSKLGGERELDPGATVVRTSWVCGRHGANMVKTVLRLAGEHDQLSFVDDQHGCPTFTADLAAGMIAAWSSAASRASSTSPTGADHVVRLRPGHLSWVAGHDPEPGAPHHHRRARPGPARAPAGELRARQRRPAPVGAPAPGRPSRTARTPGERVGGVMSKIAVIGTGYVGLTTGAYLAHLGHDVVCADVVEEKVERLQRGEIPILEAGLEELVREGLDGGRLSFVLGAANAARRRVRLPLRADPPGRGRLGRPHLTSRTPPARSGRSSAPRPS